MVCLCLLRCALTVCLQVHGKLAASPSKPEAAPGVGDMLRLMWEAAQKPLLWYLTLVGFLVSAAAPSTGPGVGTWCGRGEGSTLQHDTVSACKCVCCLRV